MSDHSSHPRQDGSVLIILLVMVIGAGSMALAHLTKVVAEGKKVRSRAYSERATTAAVSNLEFAKNVVNAAPYVNGENTALLAAVQSNPPFIPGTTVEVKRVGSPTSDWFMLRATGFYQGIAKRAQAFVRQRSPVSSYNFFVIDHPLGISGAPRGAIHSNKSIDFYFPWGLYRDQVTAGEGFNYKAGAETPGDPVRWSLF